MIQIQIAHVYLQVADSMALLWREHERDGQLEVAGIGIDAKGRMLKRQEPRFWVDLAAGGGQR